MAFRAKVLAAARRSGSVARSGFGTCGIGPNSKTTSGTDYAASDWPNVYSFRSRHTGGLQFALADGSVRFVSDSIDLNSYRAMCSIKGQEVVTIDF